MPSTDDRGSAEDSGELGLSALNLNLLMVFDTVMVERHVSRAAGRLKLTQSAVSQALGRLRLILGDQLFYKEAAGVAPTARALELWPVVHRSLQSLGQAVYPASFSPGQTNKSFGIALPDVFANALLPPLIKRTSASAPGASFHLFPYDHFLTTQRLVRAETDFEIGPYPPRLSALESQLLFLDQYLVIGRKGHPAFATQLTARQLCSLPHVVVNMTGQRDYTTEFDAALSGAGLSRQIRLTVSQFTAASTALLMTDLVAVMPKQIFLQPGTRELLDYRPLPMKMPECRTYLVWHRRSSGLAAHNWLKGHILDIAAAMENDLKQI